MEVEGSAGDDILPDVQTMTITSVADGQNSTTIHHHRDITHQPTLIVDPILKYLNRGGHSRQQPSFNVDEAIEALKTDGYYVIQGVLTQEECNKSLDDMW